jgi:cystathionine beta-lyase
VVVKDEELARQVYFLQNAEGTTLGPFDCYLVLRGLKTLKLRMDAQQANAVRIAEFLQGHGKVATVHYPGMRFHPGYAVQMRQARGGGAVLSFSVESAAAAKIVAEKTELFKIAVSFGSVNSTISVPLKMSHASTPAAMKDARGIPAELIRVSVGIEDGDELIADLGAALASV